MHNLQKLAWTHLNSKLLILAERYQKVALNGKSSHSVHATSGVPQSSILGHLFLIYIDDISKVSLSERSQLVLYADDNATLPSHQ